MVTVEREIANIDAVEAISEKDLEQFVPIVLELNLSMEWMILRMESLSRNLKGLHKEMHALRCSAQTSE